MTDRREVTVAVTGDATTAAVEMAMAAWRKARLALPPTLGRRLPSAEGSRSRLFATAAEARIAARAAHADRLSPRPDRVRDTRDLVKKACRTWHLPQDTALILSELAFVVTVSRNATRVHVAVQDGGPGFPRPCRSATHLQHRGRGRLPTDAITAGWAPGRRPAAKSCGPRSQDAGRRAPAVLTSRRHDRGRTVATVAPDFGGLSRCRRP